MPRPWPPELLVRPPQLQRVVIWGSGGRSCQHRTLRIGRSWAPLSWTCKIFLVRYVKSRVHCIMPGRYAARTNGTYTLRKGSAISWHYGDADGEFGSLQAKELQVFLITLICASSS